MAPCHGATPAQTYYGSPVKLEKYGKAGSCGQLWEESEMVAEEDWRWDLNPGAAAIPGEHHAALAEKGERTTQLWHSGDPMAATQLMVPGA